MVGNTRVYYVMYVSVENALLGHKEPETEDGDITDRDQTERARLSHTASSSLLNPESPAPHTRSVELSDPSRPDSKDQPSKAYLLVLEYLMGGRDTHYLK